LSDANSSSDLHIKPVNFHAYLYCVLEHGRKANLSIMKFRQENGAASSFYRVVETLEKVFNDKSMMVTDPARRKGIERSLKEARL
jgi:serine/threonine-protein kinase HSL1, negative regulator of Swe1 kinase